MLDPTRHSATELLTLLADGSLTAVDATAAFLARSEEWNPRIGAFLRYDANAAIAQAEVVDRKRRAGEPLGKLAGLPIAVKDLVAAKGELTTCGSRMLAGFVAPYDATIIEKLRAADAVLLGRTNMDEFAMGGSNENSAFFPCRNPWDPTRIPGGSSGGAAACIAADMTPLSIGSDTGGSIRQPASMCGVTGLKPTYGRVSRYGLVAYGSSLDQLGPLARSAADAALLLETIAGHDPRDATSLTEPVEAYSRALDQPLRGLRIGIVPEHFAAGLDGEVAAAVRDALKVYESLGATIREIELPHAQYGVAAYYIVASCEASSNLSRYDGVRFGNRADEKKVAAELERERAALTAAGRKEAAEWLDGPLVRLYRRSRSEGFGPEVRRRIMLGTYALSAGYYDAYYLKALKTRRLIKQDYDRAFEQVDLIAGPVASTPAFRIGEKVDDPLAMYLVDLYTVGANLAGVPGISLPCGFSATGLPIGLQLQGPALSEARLLQAAHGYQTQTDWHLHRPTLAPAS